MAVSDLHHVAKREPRSVAGCTCRGSEVSLCFKLLQRLYNAQSTATSGQKLRVSHLVPKKSIDLVAFDLFGESAFC